MRGDGPAGLQGRWTAAAIAAAALAVACAAPAAFADGEARPGETVVAERWTMVEALVAGKMWGGEAIVILGSADGPVSVTVNPPGGGEALEYSAKPGPDGRLDARIDAGGIAWSLDGTYGVVLRQEGDPARADRVGIRMAGGEAVPVPGMAGRPLPAGLPASLADARLIDEEWKVIEEVAVRRAEGRDAVLVRGSAPEGGASVSVAGPGGERVAGPHSAGPDAGPFEAVVYVDGGGWQRDGAYVITVQAGGHSDPFLVDVAGGRVDLGPGAAAEVGAINLGTRWNVVEGVSVARLGGAETLIVRGTTDRPQEPVSVEASPPGGGAPAFGGTVMPDLDGGIEARIPLEGEAWGLDGAYAVVLRQGGAPPYADGFPVLMAGGRAVPTPEYGGAEPPEGASIYEDLRLVDFAWSLAERAYVESFEGRPDHIVVEGITDRPAEEVAVVVRAPGGAVVVDENVGPGSDGRFAARIIVGGEDWAEDGTYGVAVSQGHLGTGPPDRIAVEVAGGRAAPGPGAADDGGIEGEGGRIAAIGYGWNMVEAVAAARVGGEETLVVAGRADPAGGAVAVSVTSPGGEEAGAAVAVPGNDGRFTARVAAGGDGSGWGADGTYAAEVLQEGATGGADALSFTVRGGKALAVQEFEGLAAPAIEGDFDEVRVLVDRWVLVESAFVERRGGTDTVVVAGTTDRAHIPIGVKVRAPGGGTIASYAIGADPRDGGFEVRERVAGKSWEQDGTYRITLVQGQRPAFTDLVLVDVAGGAVVPEFGPLAAAALAAAVAAAVIAASCRAGAGPAARWAS